MSYRGFSRAITALVIIGAPVIARCAEKPADHAEDEAAIRASAAEFIKAFAAGDAKTIAAQWSESGTLADEQGQVYKGRKAIEDEYIAFFKREPGAKIEVSVTSVEFPAPNVAIEDGVARVIAKHGEPPVASRYTAVHARDDGKWRIVSVRESAIDLPSNAGQLAELDFLVGKWEAKADTRSLETSIRWIANKSFLERSYTVRDNGVTVSSGRQIIGWDPQAGKIRSWSFDSSGGHGTGLWTADSEGWQIESQGVMADGTPTSAHDHLVRVPGEDDVFGFRSSDRKVGDSRLPDLKEVVLDRVKEKAAKK